MELTFEIKDVTDIKVRIPTLSEFLYITDKLVSAYGGGKSSSDFMDDGEAEIVNLVTYPTKRDFSELLLDYQDLAFIIWAKIKDELGADVELNVEPKLTDESEISTYGKRCLAISYMDGNETKRFIFRKLGHPTFKRLSRDISERGSLTGESLCKIAKEAVASGNKSEIDALFSEKPALALLFGKEIVNASSTAVELFIKKA